MRFSESFSESFSQSRIRRDELLVCGFRSFRCEDRRRDQNAITESYACMRSERKIQLLLAVAENFLAERIRGKKPIAARVPVRRKARILGMIENRDSDWFVADQTAQIAPPSASTPGSVAFIAFAGKVGPVDACIVQRGHLRGAPAGVNVALRFVAWNF